MLHALPRTYSRWTLVLGHGWIRTVRRAHNFSMPRSVLGLIEDFRKQWTQGPPGRPALPWAAIF
ncbi:hypothetical protein J2W42_002907 [Rhizobium tibeticum]|nr:hypothetical protein [Rhizobium tibeticum]